MKKLFILLLSALSLTAYAQGKKTVAVLDPICRDGSVNNFYQQMVRGAMESAITVSSEYEAYDRSAFDQIQKEQAFQRTGAVNDFQIKKMGEMAGVDYVLVSEVSAYEGYLSTVIKVLNVITGKYDKSTDAIMELKPETVKSKCSEMAVSLFGMKLTNEELYNFGRIKEEGGRVTHVFILDISTDQISNVHASCECVSYQLKPDIYLQNKTNLIVTYNPNGRPGKFHKTVTVHLINGIIKKLFIEGEVIPRNNY